MGLTKPKETRREKQQSFTTDIKKELNMCTRKLCRGKTVLCGLKKTYWQQQIKNMLMMFFFSAEINNCVVGFLMHIFFSSGRL